MGCATDLIFQKYGFVPLNYSAAWRGIGHAGNWNSGDVIGRIVPWLSYSFFHRDLGRALLYSALLLAFGSIVARRIGAVAFLAFYLVCAAVGAAAHLALHWGSAEPLVARPGRWPVSLPPVSGCSAAMQPTKRFCGPLPTEQSSRSALLVAVQCGYRIDGA